MMSDYVAVVADLQARRNEIERQIGALRGEQKRLDEAMALLGPMVSSLTSDQPRTDQIVAYVFDAGKWLTHAEIIRGLCPGSGLGYSRERHVVRTQIGQLVRRGELRQHEMLIGLPAWDPPQLVSLGHEIVSARNGRRQNIERVLAEANRPLHIKEVCAELLRLNLDADERCVATALAVHAKSQHPKWRKVADATYQIVTEAVN